MAITDDFATFSDAQALTATAVSTYTIPLTDTTDPLNVAANLFPDLGGADLEIVLRVGTEMDSAADGAVLTVTLESADDKDLTTNAVVHATSSAIAEATLTAGAALKLFKFPTDGGENQYKDHVGLRYTVSTENFTDGTISSRLERSSFIGTQFKDHRSFA